MPRRDGRCDFCSSVALHVYLSTDEEAAEDRLSNVLPDEGAKIYVRPRAHASKRSNGYVPVFFGVTTCAHGPEESHAGELGAGSGSCSTSWITRQKFCQTMSTC